MVIRKGDVFSTINFGDCVVLEYYDWRNVLIQFLSTGYECICDAGALRKGKVKDKLKPFLWGVGYLGGDEYSGLTHKKIYTAWAGMLSRCYSEAYQKRRKTYIGCAVCDDWHNFQKFAKWYEENQPKGIDDYQLDKDLLMQGNRIYSPSACTFVPREVNQALTRKTIECGDYEIGVSKNKGSRYFRAILHSKQIGKFSKEKEAFSAYKSAKEKHMKELAEKYKSNLSKEAYCALLSFELLTNSEFAKKQREQK